MKLALIAFTGDGSRLCARLCGLLRLRGHEASGYVPERFRIGFPELFSWGSSAAVWTRERFPCVDGLIFIGAAGIAVRLIAPCLKDKFSDPAVLVVDDQAVHVISLLSGHSGGANRLTAEVAGLLHADPVITTATDLRGRTAIDVWAGEQALHITDRELAKRAAQAVADGRPVGVTVDEELGARYREAADALIRENGQSYLPGSAGAVHVRITVRTGPPEGRSAPDADTLRLVPKLLVLGIGCRKGIPEETAEAAVRQALAAKELAPEAVAAVASIDLKEKEPGLLGFAKKLGVPFLVFSSKELAEPEGAFARSDFVRRVAGVENVCERAAVCGALRLSGRESAKDWQEQVTLLLPKTAEAGVTVAAALFDPGGMGRQKPPVPASQPRCGAQEGTARGPQQERRP